MKKPRGRKSCWSGSCNLAKMTPNRIDTQSCVWNPAFIWQGSNTFGTVTSNALSAERRLNGDESENHGRLRTVEELWAFSGEEKGTVVSSVCLVWGLLRHVYTLIGVTTDAHGPRKNFSNENFSRWSGTGWMTILGCLRHVCICSLLQQWILYFLPI